MNRDLTNYRRSYEKGYLLEKDIPDTPLLLFEQWFKEVESAGGVEEANAMTITTIGLDGFPKARIVLLKQYDEEGFVFYTNYNSEKGKAMAKNNQVCLSFFWPNLERQVIIKGVVQKTTEEKSTAYYRSRPRGSQLGAWASDQSDKIKSGEYLEKKLREFEKQFDGVEELPKPPYWGGYCVMPVSYEFWQGRPNRLHDRILFSKDGNDWKIDRLSP
ncbi:pyridoxamine 5'-phosphate oxidase [Aquimarina hainanensis]|uniref:Pyridoxine/pyridoxamine 5'-phosphate oxidase n=1 Tax=Aquimarina hainanensis TaxID=1578017 RepID=A0ABW5ND52_9FLAO